MDLYRNFLEVLFCFYMVCQQGTSVISADGNTPNFDVPVVNVTAIAGSTAILPCKINSIGDHKVVWLDYRKKVLTMKENRVIHDPRVSVERPFTRDWNLHIRKVRMNDTGEYRCQINTQIVKSKKIILIVQEPPMIVETSGDQTVSEGETVTIHCRATGVPMPYIKWYRLFKGDDIQEKKALGEEGEILMIHNVSRYCDDTYECEADNGIDPPASRQIKVSVQFKPEVQVLNMRLYQRRGMETILDCSITANPQNYITWMKDGETILHSMKYGINVYPGDRYTKTLSLRIGNLDENDFGRYECFAKNELGSDEDVTFLTEQIERHRIHTTTTSTTTEYAMVFNPGIDNTRFSYDTQHQNTWNDHVYGSAEEPGAAYTGPGSKGNIPQISSYLTEGLTLLPLLFNYIRHNIIC